MNAIEFNDVSFAFPGSDRPTLAHVDLTIPEGSFALTVGATGSGKSTLLRSINGLVPHFTGGTFSGRVRVEGRDTMASAPRKMSDVVAFVPQDPGASFVMDRVEDELAYAMENLGVETTTMRRRVEETLDLLDIERLRGRGVRTLSGGERQRVAIASALTAGPRVLVLDEPTSQLDPQGAEDVLAALKRLVDDLGLTVVIAEHRLERVAGFADLALGCRVGLPPLAGEVARVFSMLEVGPPVSRLGRALGWDPPPLTVRAARAERARIELGEPPTPDAPAPGANVIACGHLRVVLGGTEVLRGIDLEVGANEVVALMGRNGAGKTTLLRALTGLITPESGGVAFRGHEPRPGHDVAFCPHDPESVLYRDRVRTEIETTIQALGSDVTADDLLEMFELTAVADAHPRDLSAGERSLVAIAAIAASGADALLLDEPTRGLDPETKQRLGRSMRAWAAEGRGVVFATHDVETAAEFADRVVMLAGGEVIADGSPRSVLGESVVFATQTARVFGPGWLTPADVESAVARRGRVPS